VSADYGALLTALSAAASRREADLAAAERAYADGVAAAAAEVRRAGVGAQAAEKRAAAAAGAVVDVDRAAGRLWDELRRVRSPWAPRSGPLPEPIVIVDGSASPDAVVAALDRAGRRIDAARRGAPRAPLPKPVTPVLPVLGAAVAAVVGILAGGLVAVAALGPPGAGVVRALGWLAYLVAPFAGIPVAAAWVGRRFDSRLDPGALGLIVVGGLVALCGLAVLFTR
jgi:hypothetical protein